VLPLTLSINDAASSLGIGRTKLYQLINAGKLEAVRIGRRTLVKTASIEALVAACSGRVQ
jgi:excisionase family DNA binding protein